MSLQVKICGITRATDANQAASLGATALGFIFAKSPRQISATQARSIVDELEFEVEKVGVFVDSELKDILDHVDRVGLTAVQLHGQESSEFAEQLKQERPTLKIIKAVAFTGAGSLAAYSDFACDLLLVDRPRPAQKAGPIEIQALLQEKPGRPYLIAGGLDGENIGDYVEKLRPAGVDLSSGIESSPGIKDIDKMTALFKALAQQENKTQPGRFGNYGGAYVPETLMQPILELTKAYEEAREDESFEVELRKHLRDFVGRQTPLYFAERLSEHCGGGTKIYLKREDLTHTGAHKINNALGQVLLAKRMGKTRIIAETGAGQHGVATAAVASRFGLKCVVYMGNEDVKRQSPNVQRMKLLGAEVIPVCSGSQTLKDAVSEAMRDWVTNIADSYYLLGSALGPHPYPTMVRDFQAVIGEEAREQILDQEGRLPDELIACVGGGSNAIGLFHAFRNDASVRMTGVEAGGRGPELGQHAARFQGGALGVFQGTETFLLQDETGQVALTHSISAGLDYAAVGPEHSHLRAIGRAEYFSVTDKEALEAFHSLSRTEGIIPALESSHALAHAMKKAKDLPRGSIIIVNLSGRGDKDLSIVERYQDDESC